MRHGMDQAYLANCWSLADPSAYHIEQSRLVKIKPPMMVEAHFIF